MENDEAYELLKAEIGLVVKDAIKEAVSQLVINNNSSEEKLWCGPEEAKAILGVQKTKLQQLRDESPENGLRFSKDGRTIRYYIPSLHQYLENRIVE